MLFGMKMYLAYFVGLLPFMKIPYDLAALPRLTRDYTERKIQQLKDDKYPLNVKLFFALQLAMSPLTSFAEKGMIRHLNNRGILTSYYVINRDDELTKILKTSDVKSVMSDRPTATFKRI